MLVALLGDKPVGDRRGGQGNHVLDVQQRGDRGDAEAQQSDHRTNPQGVPCLSGGVQHAGPGQGGHDDTQQDSYGYGQQLTVRAQWGLEIVAENANGECPDTDSTPTHRDRHFGQAENQSHDGWDGQDLDGDRPDGLDLVAFKVCQSGVAVKLPKDRIGVDAGERAHCDRHDSAGTPEASNAPGPGQARRRSHDGKEAHEQDDHSRPAPA